ncbi:MAG TPA: electron transfer flavoprotein subunit beta/FixA family protein [Chloroflexota bacterium]|jgi:electron transfer flavoprotein alpha/beta subunit|nr:electron transfer flavoprotein subunit beta/FixA family protein [Chloroflexota bacterium]
MNIVVCVKRVPDPEAPASLYRIDETGQRLVPARSVPWLTSTYDESALEAALQLKDAHGGTVTLLSLAADDVSEWLQEVLATGADEAVLIQDAALAGGDSFVVASVLAAGIRKLGAVDLVLCGRQASDTDAGIVGPALAELLGWPSVAVARRVALENGALRVERVLDDGYEVLLIEPPAVLGVTSEQYQLRYATMPNILAASMKTIPIWTAAELGLAPPVPRVLPRRLYQPEARVACEIIAADSEEEAAHRLAQALRARGVI